MSDNPSDGNAVRLAKLIRELWLKAKPSTEAQSIRARISTAIDDAGFDSWPLDCLPDSVWDLLDVASQRAFDARDAALREAKAEIERLRTVADAARPIASAAADLLASTRDKSEIWELPAAMSITAGDLRRLEKSLAALDADSDREGV